MNYEALARRMSIMEYKQPLTKVKKKIKKTANN